MCCKHSSLAFKSTLSSTKLTGQRARSVSNENARLHIRSPSAGSSPKVTCARSAIAGRLHWMAGHEKNLHAGVFPKVSAFRPESRGGWWLGDFGISLSRRLIAFRYLPLLRPLGYHPLPRLLKPCWKKVLARLSGVASTPLTLSGTSAVFPHHASLQRRTKVTSPSRLVLHSDGNAPSWRTEPIRRLGARMYVLPVYPVRHRTGRRKSFISTSPQVPLFPRSTSYRCTRRTTLPSAAKSDTPSAKAGPDIRSLSTKTISSPPLQD